MAACGAQASDPLPAGSVQDRIVYGDDDRVEARDYPDPKLRELADTLVGALVPAEYVVAQPGGGYLLSGPALGERLLLCPSEPLSEQPALARCTAILGERNTVITAGHCIDKNQLRELRFVQGYALGGDYPAVPARRVHSLGRILSFENGDIALQSGDDFAIVELISDEALPSVVFEDPPATVKQGDAVVVVGTSEALPLKIEDGGAVYDDTPEEYFEITSDTFQGGSGSPVFAPSGAYLGTVVGGAMDYAWDDTQQCFLRNRLDAPVSRGELVVRSSVLRDALSRAHRPPTRPPQAETSCAVRRGGVVSSDVPLQRELALVLLLLCARRRRRQAHG